MNNELNAFLFSTPEMAHIFSPQQQLRAMARFEWALTRALEMNGIAHAGSAAVLQSLLDADFVDRELLGRDASEAGNIAIPFVLQLTAAVGALSQAAARDVHLGTTSQDLLDSALILQIRDALKLIQSSIALLDAALVKQVRDHRNTIMTGRTWLQPGPPVTLGLKLAGTLAALRRSHDRLHAVNVRVLVLQFGGAVGTLSALGALGPAVSAELARSLDLREPDLPWHSQRDNLVEMVQVLAIVTGTLAKFARDIALLMQAEVGEASEGNVEGRGCSSTMPHKRNPVACAAIVAAHAQMPGLAATMLNAMPQEHERGMGLWQAEWQVLPEAFRLCAEALGRSIEIAEGLEVDPAAMESNLNRLLGIPLSESVSAALSQKIGRPAAHDLLRTASRLATERKQTLADILKHLPEVTAHLSNEMIDELLDPRHYLGSAQLFISRVLGETDARD